MMASAHRRREGSTGESLLIPERWLPLTRTLWYVVAALCILVFVWTLILTHRFVESPPDRLLEGTAALGWTMNGYYWFTVLTITPLFLSGMAVGAVLFWFRPGDRMALFTSIFLMSFLTANSFSPATEYLVVVSNGPLSFKVSNLLVGVLSYGLMGVFFGIFPDSRFVPRWSRWTSLLALPLSVIWGLIPDVAGDVGNPVGFFGLMAVGVVLVSSAYAQIWRYRHYSDPAQRQQTKWFATGMAVIVVIVLIPAVVLYAAEASSPRDTVLINIYIAVANMAFLLLPVSVGIAVLRYRLWDIDLLVRRTVQYSLLTGLLASVYFGGVVLLQGILRPLTGQDNIPLVTALTTLAVAALFNPLRRRVQRFADRQFFRTRYDSEKTLSDFAATIRDEIDLDRLSEALLQVVGETMQPQRASLWVATAEPS